MPSHIFTRLGLWEDSIASNVAALAAARRHADVGEELHSMDYLVYANLQLERDAEAAQVIQQLKAMRNLDVTDFKVAYASIAMPVRYLVERSQWQDAAVIPTPLGAPPHVIAIALWAQGVGLARSGRASESRKAAENLRRIEQQLRESGDEYWATQVRVMNGEVLAWAAATEHYSDEALRLMREAADLEDSVEKLPVTPGPIVPAREQLGELLLIHGQANLAAKEYRVALSAAPGRRAAVRGLAEATAHSDKN
jgi:hypothetical protein